MQHCATKGITLLSIGPIHTYATCFHVIGKRHRCFFWCDFGDLGSLDINRSSWKMHQKCIKRMWRPQENTEEQLWNLTLPLQVQWELHVAKESFKAACYQKMLFCRLTETALWQLHVTRKIRPNAHWHLGPASRALAFTCWWWAPLHGPIPLLAACQTLWETAGHTLPNNCTAGCTIQPSSRSSCQPHKVWQTASTCTLYLQLNTQAQCTGAKPPVCMGSKSSILPSILL